MIKRRRHQTKVRSGKEKICDSFKKVGHLVDNCNYLKRFPSIHPLHGVFSRPDKKGPITEKNTTRNYYTDSTSGNNTKATTITPEDFLSQIKALMDSQKEESKIIDFLLHPFTTITSLLRHKSYFTQSKNPVDH